MKSTTINIKPLIASTTLAIALASIEALENGSELIGDWQRENGDGTRILVKLQRDDFGIRHHFSREGPLQYSVAFEWFEASDGLVVIDRNSDGSVAVSRDLEVRECDGTQCIAFDGLGAPFLRIAP